MVTTNEWETFHTKAEETVVKYRQGKMQLRFVDAQGEPRQGLKIHIAQKTQDFLFGNLIFDLVSNEPYKPELFKQRFLELFNFAIFPFYWHSYEKEPGRTEWQKMLPVLDWCKANNVTPKGHPLVWPYSAGVPEWLYEMPEGSVEALIKARVLSLMRGFAPAIQTWDVTNEAVNHISWNEATQPDFCHRYYEVSLWRGIEVSGAFKREIPITEAADWVESSLRWAYAANPQATLIVNDYNQELEPHIRQRFFDLIHELKRRGAPISGMGLQVHPLDYWLAPHEMWETLEMYAELDLPIHITELHQPSWDQEIQGGFRTGRWSPEAQAEFIEQLYRQCFGHPAVVSINYWGLSDRNSWIPSGCLVDAEYRPKPVFTALKKLIKGEWMTAPFTAETDENGEISFTGFHGLYEVTELLPGKKNTSRVLHLAEGQENVFQLSEVSHGTSRIPVEA